MKLYNKGGRAIIVRKEDIISGGRQLPDENAKDKIYIDPQATVQIKDEVGEKLCRNYPKDLMNLSQGESRSSVAKTKKTAAKKNIATKKKARK